MAKSTSSTASSVSSSSSGSSASTSTSGCTTSSSGSSATKLLGIKPKNPATDRRKRLAANARERKRMHLLNKAYDQLRQRLVDAENKSKYDILVQAKEYIQALAKICENFDSQKEQTGQVNVETANSQLIGEPDSPLNMTKVEQVDISNSIKSEHLIQPQASQYHHLHYSQSVYSPASVSSMDEQRNQQKQLHHSQYSQDQYLPLSPPASEHSIAAATCQQKTFYNYPIYQQTHQQQPYLYFT